jgi:hypothetical protein
VPNSAASQRRQAVCACVGHLCCSGHDDLGERVVIMLLGATDSGSCMTQGFNSEVGLHQSSGLRGRLM